MARREHRIAFGAFSDLPAWLLIVGVVIVAVGIGALAVRSGARVPWPAAGLLAGGAAGNLIDRIGDGRVTDFIDLGRWPAFNVADIAITTAMIVLLVLGTRPEQPVARTPTSEHTAS